VVGAVRADAGVVVVELGLAFSRLVTNVVQCFVVIEKELVADAAAAPNDDAVEVDAEGRAILVGVGSRAALLIFAEYSAARDVSFARAVIAGSLASFEMAEREESDQDNEEISHGGRMMPDASEYRRLLARPSTNRLRCGRSR
jgi:hypothetical protein